MEGNIATSEINLSEKASIYWSRACIICGNITKNVDTCICDECATGLKQLLYPNGV